MIAPKILLNTEALKILPSVTGNYENPTHEEAPQDSLHQDNHSESFLITSPQNLPNMAAPQNSSENYKSAVSFSTRQPLRIISTQQLLRILGNTAAPKIILNAEALRILSNITVTQIPS